MIWALNIILTDDFSFFYEKFFKIVLYSKHKYVFGKECKMTKKVLKFGFISAAIAALAGMVFMGCKSANTIKLEGNWEVSEFELNGVAQQICVSDMTVKAKSDSVIEINGNSGVNTFFGSADVNGTSVKVRDNLASTKMAGEPAAMEYEDNFIATLAGSDTWSVTDGKLTVKNSATAGVLVFVKK